MEQNPFQQATIAHANNDLIRAKKLYLQILKKDSQNVKVLFLVGTLYLQSKKSNEAIQFLKMAYSLNKKDPHILMNLGIAYKDKQEFTNAEKDYSKNQIREWRQTYWKKSIGLRHFL